MKQVIVSTFFQALIFSGIIFMNEQKNVQGDIHINGDVMRVTQDAEIEGVTMYGRTTGKAYYFSGCGEEDCDYDVSAVVVDCYDVVVETTEGNDAGYVCRR